MRFIITFLLSFAFVSDSFGASGEGDAYKSLERFTKVAASIANEDLREQANFIAKWVAKGQMKEVDTDENVERMVQLALDKVEDAGLKEFLRLYHAKYVRVIKEIVNFFLYECPVKDGQLQLNDILDAWSNSKPEERPIFNADALIDFPVDMFDKNDSGEYIRSKEEINALLTALRSRKDQVWVVSADSHTAVARFSYNEDTKKAHLEFWDPYEAHRRGNYIEKRLREIIESIIFPECNKCSVESYYPKHQALKMFGDCPFYAAAYKDILSAGGKLEEAEVMRLVREKKAAVRSKKAKAFNQHDAAFSFAINSGFAQCLVEVLYSFKVRIVGGQREFHDPKDSGGGGSA